MARGYPLDIRRPRFGEALPDTLDGHAGAVIFGGPMSANDNDEYIGRETEWIGVPLAEGAPFLGLCLGAQMLARHLGAAVGPDPDGRVEIGYYDLKPTEAGRRLMDWPDRVHHFHREGFGLADGATLLADRRRLSQPGVLLRPCRFRPPVPHRADHGDGRPLDAADRRTGAAARRPGAGDPFRRAARCTTGRPRLSWKSSSITGWHWTLAARLEPRSRPSRSRNLQIGSQSATRRRLPKP